MDTHIPEAPFPHNFGQALAQNRQALDRFCDLPLRVRQEFLLGAQALTTPPEVTDYIDELARNTTF